MCWQKKHQQIYEKGLFLISWKWRGCHILLQNSQNFLFLERKNIHTYILKILTIYFYLFFQKWYLIRNDIWLVKSFLDTRYLIRRITKLSTTYLQLRISRGFLPLFLRVSIISLNIFRSKMVFCYQNCSDLLWEIIVLRIEKNVWNSRLKAEDFQKFWDPLNNLFKQ